MLIIYRDKKVIESDMKNATFLHMLEMMVIIKTLVLILESLSGETLSSQWVICPITESSDNMDRHTVNITVKGTSSVYQKNKTPR